MWNRVLRMYWHLKEWVQVATRKKQTLHTVSLKFNDRVILLLMKQRVFCLLVSHHLVLPQTSLQTLMESVQQCCCQTHRHLQATPSTPWWWMRFKTLYAQYLNSLSVPYTKGLCHFWICVLILIVEKMIRQLCMCVHVLTMDSSLNTYHHLWYRSWTTWDGGII